MKKSKIVLVVVVLLLVFCTLGLPELGPLQQNSNVKFFLNANDFDTGDILTFDSNNLPVGLEITDTNQHTDANGVVWAKAKVSGNLPVGEYKINFGVTDNHGARDTDYLMLTVGNRPPSFFGCSK